MAIQGSDGRGDAGRQEEVMTRDDLLTAEPITASEPFPEELLHEFLDDRIVFGREQELVAPEDLPSAELRALDPNRPPWLTQTFLPRMAPRPLPSDLFKRLDGRPIPLALLAQPTTEVFDRSYPWCTIGRVISGTGRPSETTWPRLQSNSGTGVMVGRNLMLTASHLVPWGAGDWWMRFIPSYWGSLNGSGFSQPFGSAFIARFRGVRTTDDVTGRDVVICQLDRPLGDLVGWMGSFYFGNDAAYKDHRYSSVGYPGAPTLGQRPIIQPFAAIDDVDVDGDGRELETHPFTSHGWSGGPLWFWRNNSPYAVGVCSGREKEFDFWEFFLKNHSVFAGGPRIVNLVRHGMNQWA